MQHGQSPLKQLVPSLATLAPCWAMVSMVVQR